MAMRDVHTIEPGETIVVPEGFPLMRHDGLDRPAQDQRLCVAAIEHEPQRDRGSFTVRLVFGDSLWAEYDSRDRVNVVTEA
jgi:hypothetical protein